MRDFTYMTLAESLKQDFQGKDLRGADFTGSDLRGVSFYDANLKGATFINADLRGVIFDKSYPRNADFSGARVDSPLVFSNIHGKSRTLKSMKLDDVRWEEGWEEAVEKRRLEQEQERQREEQERLEKKRLKEEKKKREKERQREALKGLIDSSRNSKEHFFEAVESFYNVEDILDEEEKKTLRDTLVDKGIFLVADLLSLSSSKMFLFLFFNISESQAEETLQVINKIKELDVEGVREEYYKRIEESLWWRSPVKKKLETSINGLRRRFGHLSAWFDINDSYQDTSSKSDLEEHGLEKFLETHIRDVADKLMEKDLNDFEVEEIADKIRGLQKLDTENYFRDELKKLEKYVRRRYSVLKQLHLMALDLINLAKKIKSSFKRRMASNALALMRAEIRELKQAI